MNADIDGIIAAVNKVATEAVGDYLDDRLLYCGNCNTPKQTVIKMFGGERTVGCMCQCECDRYEREKKCEADQQRAMYINSLRVNGYKDLGSLQFIVIIGQQSLLKNVEVIEHIEKHQKARNKGKQEPEKT